MLFRLLLWIVTVFLAVRAAARLFGGISQGVRGPAGSPPVPPVPVKMVKDPVCGTFVVPGKTPSLTDGDSTHWFCSERCRQEYAHRG